MSLFEYPITSGNEALKNRKERGTKMGAKIGKAIVLGVFAAVLAAGASPASALTTIRYATYFTPAYPELFPAMLKFVETVNEKGKGKVKIEFFHSETLLKANDLFSGLIGGSTEAVTVPMVYWHGTLPISQGLSLPFIWKGELDRYNKALAPGTPLAKFLNENFAKKNVFCFFGVVDDQEYLWTKGKNVKSLEDMKGMKIRTSGLIPSEVIKRVMASPVSMPSPDVYTALQRGTVDGLLGSITTIYSRSLHEQVRYMTRYPFDNFGPELVAFRKDWYDKQPDEVKTILQDAAKVYRDVLYSKSMQVTEEQISVIKKHVQFIDPSRDSKEAFNKALLPMYDWWVNRPEIGEAGKKILERIRATE